MPYKTKDLFKIAKEAILKHRLLFIEDVVVYLPCRKSTFYNHFPVESDDMDELKTLINKNKVDIKVSLRSKWYKSDNATLQMALYKLTASPEELKKLQMQYVDHTSDGDKITPAKQIYRLPDGTEISFE